MSILIRCYQNFSLVLMHSKGVALTLPCMYNKNTMSKKRKSAPCDTPSTTKKSKTICPTRNSKGHLIFEDYPDFLPNKSPKEIMQAGAFGGTYFRPIKSSVTGEKYKDVWEEFPEDWFEGLNINLQVASPTYDKDVNKYKVKGGASLEEWEKSGWIKAQDPYGWFQWYCRFYIGRRTSDDDRQVGRWKKFLARFKPNLVNKINKANAKYDDFTISPVIRQSLLHWGYEVTEKDLQKIGGLNKQDIKRLADKVPIM